jgi:hypothetical protein
MSRAGTRRDAFTRACRRLTLESVAVVLVAFGGTLREGTPYPQAWRFVGRHPTLVVHVLLGLLIVVEAGALLARAARDRRPGRIVLAATGFMLVAAAAVCGERYVGTQQVLLVDLMGVAWFLGLLCYTTGWVAGRRG